MSKSVVVILFFMIFFASVALCSDINYQSIKPVSRPNALNGLLRDSGWTREEYTNVLLIHYCYELDNSRKPIRSVYGELITTDDFKSTIVDLLISNGDLHLLDHLSTNSRVRTDIRNLSCCVLAANGDIRHRGKVKQFLSSDDYGLQYCAIKAIVWADIDECIGELKGIAKSEKHPKGLRESVEVYLKSKEKHQSRIDQYVKVFRIKLDKDLKKSNTIVSLPDILLRSKR